MLVKRIYGIEKRSKLHRVNQWDCRPSCIRKAQERKFEARIEKLKTEAAVSAVASAVSDRERKKAIRTQS